MVTEYGLLLQTGSAGGFPGLRFPIALRKNPLFLFDESKLISPGG
jgi:hypothetical protein